MRGHVSRTRTKHCCTLTRVKARIKHISALAKWANTSPANAANEKITQRLPGNAAYLNTKTISIGVYGILIFFDFFFAGVGYGVVSGDPETVDGDAVRGTNVTVITHGSLNLLVLVGRVCVCTCTCWHLTGAVEK